MSLKLRRMHAFFETILFIFKVCCDRCSDLYISVFVSFCTLLSYEIMCFRIIIKNLLLGYFHTPPSKRHEALQVIGQVLSYSRDEMKEVIVLLFLLCREQIILFIFQLLWVVGVCKSFLQWFDAVRWTIWRESGLYKGLLQQFLNVFSSGQPNQEYFQKSRLVKQKATASCRAAL